MKLYILLFLQMFFVINLIGNDNPIHLKYWVLFSGGDARPMQLMVDKFNASHKNINVKMEIIRWAEYYPTLNKNINTKNAPDIAIIHASLLPWYVNRNALADLTPYSFEWQNLPSHLIQAIRFDQKYYALPLDMHPQVFYFNKMYLAKAHLLDKNGHPIIGKGIDGFVEFLQKLQSTLPSDVVAFSTPNDNVLNWWIWYSLYSQQQNGGYIVNNKVAFNNEAGKKAFEFFYKMRQAKIWNKDIHDEKGYNLFKFNKSATMITGVWTTWNFQQNKDLDFGVVEFPKIFEKSANFGDSHTLTVLQSNDLMKQKASMEFIKWISDNSYDWAVSGQVPANLKVSKTEAFKKLPFRQTFIKSANDMILYPKNIKLKECNDAMIKILRDFLRNDDSVDETMTKAEQTLNTILKKPE